MTKVKMEMEIKEINGNKRNQTSFHGTYLNLAPFFMKTLKYFNDFENRNCSIL